MAQAQAFIDANILIRLFTYDDPPRAVAAAALMEEAAVGHVNLIVTETTLAETAWVLRQRYGVGRPQIAELLRGLLSSQGVTAREPEMVDAALDLYAGTRLNFGDALLAARALVHGPPLVYSFDRDFERVPGLRRLEPGEAPA